MLVIRAEDQFGMASVRIGTILAAALALILCAGASASEYHVLRHFCYKSGCSDGQLPMSALILDGAGNLYGTTSLGGIKNAGVVFQIDRTGATPVYRRLFNFQNCDSCGTGFNPQAPVMLDVGGAIYGTAYNGGSRGVGTLFKLTPIDGTTHWHAHVYHDFCSSSFCSDGSNPISGVFYPGSRNGAPYDGNSWTYGVTIAGGQSPYGVLYRWSPKGGEHIAKSFCLEQGCTDGAQPNGEVVFNDAGYACGTTRVGGAAQKGTFYCLEDSDASWTYSFCRLENCVDGSNPQAGVVPDGNNNLLGTTRLGGRFGQGTVYAISSVTHEERPLYSFCRLTDCADGKNPVSSVLLVGGTIYGTTLSGGRFGGGTIYKIDSAGHETVLYSFCHLSGCVDGYLPQAGLVTDGDGHLFGTASAGGRFGAGAVFELDL